MAATRLAAHAVKAMTHGYLIGKELGAGAMGRVLSATRTWDGRRVALKLLHLRLSRDPVARRTLATEALASAAVAHEGVVEVLDLDEHPDHGMFVVSELVEGPSMRKFLSEGLPVARGMAMLRDLLAAVGAAHAAGIVHGDLKPANVLVTASGRVKVCDFGIAQVLTPPSRGAARRTAGGTPRYMAPEQFVSGLALDPRTDVYAAGVMLYELVYRASPFPAAAMGPMVLAKLAPVSPPLMTSAGEPVALGLRHLLADALHPDLRRRPRFAAELSARIGELMEGTNARARHGTAGIEAPPAEDTLWTPLPPSLCGEPSPDTWMVAHEAHTILLGAVTQEAPREMKTVPGQFQSSFIPTSHLPGTALVHMRQPPIIGRRVEKERLLRAAEKVIAERRTQVILVSGALGSGKSRIAEWLCAWAESTGKMEGATARFSGYAGRNASGLRAMLSALFAPAAPRPADAVRATCAWIKQVAQTAIRDEEMLTAWLTAGRVAHSDDPAGTASLALGGLCAYAAARPLCLWFDDLSLAEDGSIELVARVAAERPAVPILVIATLAEQALEDASLRSRMGLDRVQVTSMNLGLLTQEERVSLFRALLPLRAGVAERAAVEVEGIPLFLVQRVAHWVEARMLIHGDEGLAPERDDVSLYRAMDSDQLIDERVAAHFVRAPQSSTVLYLLALLGPFGDGRGLAEACAAAGVSVSVMDLVLEEGLCHGVLRARADEVTFAHSSLRASVLRRAWKDASYPKLASAAADALSAVALERPGARSYMAVLQRDAGAIATAFETLIAATDMMARGGDHDQAERQLVLLRKWKRESREALTHALADELDLIEARVAYFSENLLRVRAVLDELFARFQRRGPTASLARALTLSANTYFYADDISRCEADLETLRREVPEARDPLTTVGARAIAIEVNVAAARGDVDGAATAWEVALDNPDDYLRWVARVDLAEIEAARGRHEHARALHARAASECGPLDVHQLRAMRDRGLSLALARGEWMERQAYVEIVRTQSVAWYRTAALVALATWDATFAPETMVDSARIAVDAFAEKPHDEALTHVFLVRMRDGLRARGHAQLAARVTMLLAERAAVGARRG